MIFKNNWIRRRWWDARYGSNTYLMFALSFLNFILIFYRFFLEENYLSSNLIPNLWLFSLIFLILYIPTATLIGYWHRRTQLSVENSLKRLEDPVLARVFRIALDIKIGKASKEEMETFRKFLSKIERNSL